MSERKYSVSELDRMRRDLYWLHRPQGSYRESEHNAHLENILRTHMQNGTDPDELKAAVEELAKRETEETRKREREEGIRVMHDGKNVITIRPGDLLWNKYRPWDPCPATESVA